MRPISKNGPGLRWFGSFRSRRMARRRKQELAELCARAETASSSYRPHHHLQAAKLATALGLRDQALSLFGRAIDGYLETGRGRAAEIACQDVLANYPDVVRARRTLALVALGRGEAERARGLVRDYAQAARQFGHPELTAVVLTLMSSIGESGDSLESQAGTWSRALQAALLGTADLRRLPAT